MTAGVPCQSWSIAGKKLGFDDDRGQLWNDTLFLLNEVRPKVFLFENVKGLVDPRNKKAIDYILDRIKQAGYYAEKYLLNAYDYGVPQNRVRIYIVGFSEKKYFDRFCLPTPNPGSVQLGYVLDDYDNKEEKRECKKKARWSLSCNEQGFNDYFLFNDLRNGPTTIHSWDIQQTTARQKYICGLLLKNRRKSIYGILDGNALAVRHLQDIDSSISVEELEELVDCNILKHSPYYYEICSNQWTDLSEDDRFLLQHHENNILMVDKLKIDKEFKKRKIGVMETLYRLEEQGIVCCSEMRYDFKNTKISTGLNGINRIFLPSSKIYPTLVASDTNDFVSNQDIMADSESEWKSEFLEKIYNPKKFRRITKSEACRIQGFPADYILPESRSRWMKLIGNSVAIPVVRALAQSVVNTGGFDESDWDGKVKPKKDEAVQLEFFV